MGKVNEITKESYFQWVREAWNNELVEFYNWAAKDMPWKLRDVMEELNKDNTHPVEVSFILLCRELLRRFKKELEELQSRKPAILFTSYVF